MRKTIVAFVSLSAFTLAAQADDEKESEVALDKVPKAVLKAVEEEFEGAKIKAAVKGEDDGETFYEVEITHDGKSIDVTLDDEGEIEEVEKEVAVGDLPKEVTAAIEKKYPGAKLKEAEQVTEFGDDEEDDDDGSEKAKSDDKKGDKTKADDGDDKEDADEKGDGDEDEDEEVAYEVEITTAEGKTLEVEVSADGKEIEAEAGDDDGEKEGGTDE